MSNLLDLLGHWVLQYYGWRYLIIGLWLAVQEESAIVVSVYLLTNHYLGWPAFFVTLAFTFFIYEMFFYLSGRYIRDTRLGRYIEGKIPNYAKIQFQLHKNANVFLFLSRFVIYLNTGVLFLSGWAGIGFKKLLKIRIAANVVWFSFLISLSYFSLTTTDAVIAHQAEIGVIVFLIIIIVAQKFFKGILLKDVAIEETAEKIGEAIEKDVNQKKTKEY